LKIACLLISHLPVQVEKSADPALAEAPLVIGGRPWDDEVVLDCCPQAAAAGVYPGIQLAQAEKLCPAACFLLARESLYRVAHEGLASASGSFSPTVETARLGLVYAEVSGMERLIGPDRVLIRKLAAAAEETTGLAVQVGIATDKFTALQAARAAQPGGGLLVPAGEEAGFLFPIPLSVLPAELEMRRRLALLGIDTLGGLAALSRPAVIRQFGPEAGPLHNLAGGRDPRPVQADAPPLAVVVKRELEEPVALRNPLSYHVHRMTAELAETLTRRGYQAEGLRLTVGQADGVGEHKHLSHASKSPVSAPPSPEPIITRGMAVKPPSADSAKLERLAKQLLDRIGLERPVESLVLTSYPLRPAHLGAVQLKLFEQARDSRRERLKETLRGLRARFGELVVMVAALVGPPPPQRIQVSLGPNGLPQLLSREDRIWPVATVYESWRERRRWWGRPVLRDYYRLETRDGLARVVYCDLRSGQWLLERRPF